MEFVIGALVGAGVLSVVIAVSMARAAKEADEIENELRKGEINHEEE